MLPPSATRFRRDLLKWAASNQRSFLWRETDRSFYEVFIAEFFLTQTPAENVASVYPAFFDHYPNLEAIEAASETQLATTIEPIGFQNMRADALKKIADHYDQLPRTREGLLALPRVGEYVADATLCFALGDRRPILDRNVRRVYDRAFDEEWPSALEEQRQFALRMLPDDEATARTYSLALLDFGALICTKHNPSCSDCFARGYCTYYQNSQAIQE